MLTQRTNQSIVSSSPDAESKEPVRIAETAQIDPSKLQKSAEPSAPKSDLETSEHNGSRTKEKPKPPVKKLFGAAIVLLVLGIGGTIAFNYFSTFQETDDAYITGHIAPISSRIETNVEHIYIDDNQHVKAGQLLIELDSRDFDRKVDEARAELTRIKRESLVSKRNIDLAAKTAQAARLNAAGDSSSNDALIEQSSAAVSQARAALAEEKDILVQKEAELVRAKDDFKRYDDLEKDRAVTTSARDSARRDYDVAKASVEATKRSIDQKIAFVEQTTHQLNSARAKRVQSTGLERSADSRSIEVDVDKLQSNVSDAAIKEAEAKLADALLQKSYCRITAPVAGRIGRKTVELGQRVQPGARLFTLTEDDLWVVANFKENQLEKMEIGQPVEIKVDVMPGRTLTGVIDSFSPGSGAQFTLLPPDNATGNFTKIVQRVPVKILFKNLPPDINQKLVPGLSVIATVKLK